MCIGGMFSKPKVPALPPPPPPPTPAPTPKAPQVQGARRETRQQAAAAAGNASRVRNTGGAQGLFAAPETSRATLLGGTRRRS